MTLLRAADLRLSFGSRTLFSGLTLVLDADERVGLVGVNGSGKSTLMRILAGELSPDEGLLQRRRGSKVTYLPQEPSFPEGATVASELTVAQAALREVLDAHTALSESLRDGGSERRLSELAALSERIEQLGGWDTEHRAKKLLDRLGVKDWERPIHELSGGVRKRVAVAKALLEKPDLLMLDEPTNHLDAETVEWLEDALDELAGGLLLVTHDRYFLDGLVDRIVEIVPGEGVRSYPGNYQAYVEQKLIEEEEQKLAAHKRARWIAQEVAWLRKGVEARRTKSRPRLERARKLLAERGPARPKVPQLQTVTGKRLSKTVLRLEEVSFARGDRPILENVSAIFQGGERVGIVGPNGVGKTTLLRVLMGELPPSRGEVVVGENTRIAYYDQTREALDPEQTVYEAAGGEDFVELDGQRIALRDYLDDLLFPVPMQRMKVKALSGGERNRLLLARLFLEGANVLVLDEPTNDLDLVTLNVLERLLAAFSGTVLLVTHDRWFLDKVATRILAFEGNGKVVAYPGNFEDYRTLKARAAQASDEASSDGKARSAPAVRAKPAEPAPKPKKTDRLGYLEQRELDGMEPAIEKAESRKAELEALLQAPEVFSDAERVRTLSGDLEAISAEVDRLYARWDELSRRAGT